VKPYNFSIGDIMQIAERKMPEGWSAFRWERATGGSMVTGSIPDGVYSRGPRKGKPRRIGPKEVVVVSKNEMGTAAAAYESSSGNCWDCKGTGQVPWKWVKAGGWQHKSCDRCHGSGSAQLMDAAE
jgi:hypothetical protein